MRYLIAAGVLVGGTFTLSAIAFWIGRGKLINEWRTYCAEYAQQLADEQASQIESAWDDANRQHSERIWAELERVSGDQP